MYILGTLKQLNIIDGLKNIPKFNLNVSICWNRDISWIYFQLHYFFKYATFSGFFFVKKLTLEIYKDKHCNNFKIFKFYNENVFLKLQMWINRDRLSHSCFKMLIVVIILLNFQFKFCWNNRVVLRLLLFLKFLNALC